MKFDKPETKFMSLFFIVHELPRKTIFQQSSAPTDVTGRPGTALQDVLITEIYTLQKDASTEALYTTAPANKPV